MLRHLSVQNYALIDKLDIDFSEGLTIITGETGAGKSILVGAFSLILGQRADVQTLMDKSRKCIVEGVFNVSNYNIKDFFENNNLDYDDSAVIRREINPAGKSRAFINDTPTSLNQIKELAQKLIDIHSQHETLTINDSQFQLDIIDGYAKINDVVSKYRIKFKQYKILQQQYNSFLESEIKSKADLDYNQFLFTELDSANLKENEQAELEKELQALTHSEEIKSNLSKATYILNISENNVQTQLSEVRVLISQLLNYFPDVSEISDRINSINIETKELCRDIESIESRIVFNPEKQTEISQRLDVIYNLQQKHRVQTVAELLEILKTLDEKLNQVTSLEESIVKVKSELDKAHAELFEMAKSISGMRTASFEKIQAQMKTVLSQLGMPDSTVIINNLISEEINYNGVDKINILFSANKGSEAKELSKVASGGELSRLMLTIKSLVSQRNLLPSIIFDEIDQGVSGNIADKIGAIMKKMSSAMQVISITHLPQIASKGDVHYFVYKEVHGNSTKTMIKKLNDKQRVEEIAKMLSGKELTEAALENAKALLELK